LPGVGDAIAFLMRHRSISNLSVGEGTPIFRGVDPQLQVHSVMRGPPTISDKEANMDFKTEYPEYVAIEELIRRARLERSLYLGHAIASAIVALRDAVNGLSERTIRASRIQWRPDVPVGQVPIAQD
jgi:hypothetical protein